MNRGKTNAATVYVLILSTNWKHFVILRKAVESFLYIYIGLHAKYAMILLDYNQT